MKVVWNRAQKAVIFCFHGWGEDMERQAGRRRKREGFYGRIKTTHYFNERSNFCRIVNSVLCGVPRVGGKGNGELCGGSYYAKRLEVQEFSN